MFNNLGLFNAAFLNESTQLSLDEATSTARRYLSAYEPSKTPQAGSLGLHKQSLPTQAKTSFQHLVRAGGLRFCSRTLKGVGLLEDY